jgi:endoglycosylceramidase
VDNVAIGVRNALARAYPQVTAGTPLSFAYGAADHALDYRYSTTGPSGRHYRDRLPTALTLPAFQYPHGYRVAVAGATVTSPPNASVLTLVNNGGAIEVHVRVIREQ